MQTPASPQVATQNAMSSLWTLYPDQRWAVHLAAINSHQFQSKNNAGDDAYQQPASYEAFSTEQERMMWFRSLLRERTNIKAHRCAAERRVQG